MNNRHVPLALNLIVAAFGATGIAIVLVGFPIGAVPLAWAVVIGIAQRSDLARSFRETTPATRRRWFAAAVLLAVLAGSGADDCVQRRRVG